MIERLCSLFRHRDASLLGYQRCRDRWRSQHIRVKKFLVGAKRDGTLAVSERSFKRPIGLAVSSDARSFYLATNAQLYRFYNLLKSGTLEGQNDALFVPRQTWITVDIDIHDIGMTKDNTPVFANHAKLFHGR